MKHTIVLMALCLCIGQISSTAIIQNESNGVVGTFLGFGFTQFKEKEAYENTAENNVATTSNGTEAGSGTRVFQAQGEQIKKSEIDITNIASNNTAITYGSAGTDAGEATSGTKTVFDYIKNSNKGVTINNDAQGNTAIIDPDQLSTGGSERTAVAGVETQAREVKKSLFEVNSNAEDNVAVNNATGKAVAGIDFSADEVKNSEVNLVNTADNNTAVANDGRAIAGIQINIRESKNTGNTFVNTATNNNATSYDGGVAVSGVQTNFNEVKNDGKGKLKGDALDTTDKAYDNEARAFGDKAISGVSVNFADIKNANINIDATAERNKAYANDVPGETPESNFSAVAGVDINMGKNKNSQTQITAVAEDNVAKNYQSTPGDAIAGIKVTVGTLENTKDKGFDVDLTAKNNEAYSKNGNAIAGTLLTVGVAKNADIDYSKTSAMGNSATADSIDGLEVEDDQNIIGSTFP